MSLSKSVIVTCSVLALVVSTAIPTWGLTKSQMDEYQKEAEKTNKKLPKMLDKNIQLTKVSMEGSTLVCSIRSIVNDKKRLGHPNLKKIAKSSAVRNLCSRKDSLTRMKDGLSYKYVLYDRNGSYVYDYSVTAKDCGGSLAVPSKSVPAGPTPQKQSTPPAKQAPPAQGGTGGDVKVQ